MSGKIDNNELMKVFYEEAQELIDKMKKDLSNLIEVEGTKGVISKDKAEVVRKTKEEPSSTYRNLFRYAHTIKSSARAVGFDNLEDLAKKLERIFKKAEEGEIDMNVDHFSTLLKSVDVCRKLVQSKKISDYQKLLERLNGIIHS